VSNYDTAERINSQVNQSVEYRTDWAQYGAPEYWEQAGKFGDCEDYALAKRAALRAIGWPPEEMFLACCWCETGEYHCVLAVDTERGWFILDNRHPWPMQPSALDYKWDKALRGGQWLALSF